ncbi:MAG: transposase domain-containing protein, partial [Paracoccus sp. (in: a-proteobacteria)]|uniref:transposase domain-containing protein n=1 Tax=Paracoccus sp. TaxID=267 RepID=UPI0039E60F28
GAAINMPDSNSAERALRPTRAQTLARAMTLIETAKLNAVDPHAWLADTLDSIHDYTINRIDDPLPWKWRA